MNVVKRYEQLRRYANSTFASPFSAEEFIQWAAIKLVEGSKQRFEQLKCDYLRYDRGKSNKYKAKKPWKLRGDNLVYSRQVDTMAYVNPDQHTMLELKLMWEYIENNFPAGISFIMKQRFIYGYELQEIADKLSISESWVQVLIKKTIKALNTKTIILS